MRDTALILRESVISILINVVLSIIFFLLFFGLKAPVPLGKLGPDFFPQSFMVALMGALVPSLILRRRAGSPVKPIVLRALTAAFLAAALGGGAAYALCAARAATLLTATDALLLKAVYGGVLAAVVTPLVLHRLFRGSVKAAV